MRKKSKKSKTARIYYGPKGHEMKLYWTVKVRDATSSVYVTGNILHALNSHAGVTIGCSLSNVAMASKRAFPHPVHLASLTKSTALIVDSKKRNGEPATAVRYKHSYGKMIDLNDDSKIKDIIKNNPDLVERQFHLRPPKPRSEASLKGKNTNTGHCNAGKASVPRGALARAVRAGLANAAAVAQLLDE